MNALLCPIIALAVNVLTQILVFRLRRGAQYFRSIVEGVLSGALVFVILEAIAAARGNFLSREMAAIFLVDAPTYLALSYCSYSFVQLGQTSIRIRMYSEIASNPSGVSVDEMKREYDDKAVLEVRLQRLLESGDIILKNGRYFLGRRRFLHVSNLLFAAKRFLLGKGSEFE